MHALEASRDRHIGSPEIHPLPDRPAEREEKIQTLLSEDRSLPPDAALDLCASFDVPVAEWAVVGDEESALFAATALGYPVALKGLSDKVPHKSDAGLVILNVHDAEDARAAFRTVAGRLARHGDKGDQSRVMVQPMLSGKREVIVGGRRDPSFGPVVMFGLGGVYVEFLEDVAFRLAPLSCTQAREMIDEVRGSRLLHGVRGENAADLEAVTQVLLSVSELLLACPEISEIDINPLLVFEDGAAAIDARAVVRSHRT
jgi:acyl-CoA synthetase (NDP forming)